ncbi:DNRLRE domain-containing protein [Candidatus Fermentibacteria bacterium]|nr:DNRLRE domain-containing protein [Candidatus Fermentibacteria bacterium]
MKRIVVFLSVVAVVTVSAASLETVTLYPSQSASVAGDSDGLPDARVLMQFDLASLPKGAIVEFAGLRLTDGVTVAWESDFVPVIVGALTSGWDESASWHGPAEGESWQSPGGDWDAKHTAYRVLVTKARVPAPFWMTEIVTAWLNGDVPNHGLVAMLEEGADLADVAPNFNAETLKPSLEIRYLLPQTDQR